jgi:hypothetical protein
VKLPVSYWTAAEAADCFCCFLSFYIRFGTARVTIRLLRPSPELAKMYFFTYFFTSEANWGLSYQNRTIKTIDEIAVVHLTCMTR